MEFAQQLNALQNIVAFHKVTFGKVRTMGTYQVHDIYFTHEGVSIYACVNYTRKEVTWRNQDTGESVTK
jgi:hypothetical protein